mgnify:FL=1
MEPELVTMPKMEEDKNQGKVLRSLNKKILAVCCHAVPCRTHHVLLFSSTVCGMSSVVSDLYCYYDNEAGWYYCSGGCL